MLRQIRLTFLRYPRKIAAEIGPSQVGNFNLNLQTRLVKRLQKAPRKTCRETNMQFDATTLADLISQIMGNWTYHGACV